MITEQEQFWNSQFGDEYTDRNQGEIEVASNKSFFSKIIAKTGSLSSIIELGANRGMNLVALRELLPKVRLDAVEINEKAVSSLKSLQITNSVYHESILTFKPERKYDLAFTKTVLIHINPKYLNIVYELMAKLTTQYLLLAEYYNTTPVEILYRGHSDRLFKRDFAGEILDQHPQFSLVDYGFLYHRDSKNPQDDISWFLLKTK